MYKSLLYLKKQWFSFFVIANLLLPTAVYAQDNIRYITDILYVPLRTGAGNEYRIVNTSLKSGHKLTILEGADTDEWVRVSTESGMEGWILNQYLTKEETGRTRLARVSVRLAELEKQNQTLRQQNKELTNDNKALEQQASSASSDKLSMGNELQKIRSLSADAINLEKRYRELLESHQMLQTEQEALAVENAKLKSDQRLNFMFYGAGLMLLGVFLTIVLPVLKPNKRNSEWR